MQRAAHVTSCGPPLRAVAGLDVDKEVVLHEPACATEPSGEPAGSSAAAAGSFLCKKIAGAVEIEDLCELFTNLKLKHMLAIHRPGNVYSVMKDPSTPSLSLHDVLHPRVAVSAEFVAELAGADIDWEEFAEYVEIPDVVEAVVRDDEIEKGLVGGAVAPEHASQVTQRTRHLRRRVSDPTAEASSEISSDAFEKMLFFSITEKCIGRLLHPSMVQQSNSWSYQDIVINALRAEYKEEVLTQEYLQRHADTLRIWTPSDRLDGEVRTLALPAEDERLLALNELAKRGWSRTVWHANNSPPALVLSDLGHRSGAKTFYIKAEAKTLRRSYLLALLGVSELQKNGVETIQHFRKDRYYTKLFQGPQHGITRAIGLDPELEALRAAPPKRKRKPPVDVLALGDKAPDPGDGEAAKRSRKVQPESYRWGNALMTLKRSKAGGTSWQATCPRRCSHKNVVNPGTTCRKTMSFKGDDQSRAVQQKLKHWLNMSVNFSSRLDHQAYRPKVGDVPDEDTLLAQRLPDNYDSGAKEESSWMVSGNAVYMTEEAHSNILLGSIISSMRSEVEELFEWPARAIECLALRETGDGRLRLLARNAARRVCVHSFYSGKGTDAVACELLNQAFIDRGIGTMFIPGSACDSSEVCQRVLAMKQAASSSKCLLGYRHVFRALEERLDDETNQHWSLLQQAGSPVKSKKKTPQADESMVPLTLTEYWGYLEACVKEAGVHGWEKRSWCCLHSQLCPCYPPAEAAATSPDVGLPKSKRFRASRSGFSQQAVDLGPLTGFIAGTSCEDFSRYGKRKGIQGPRMKAFLCMCAIIKEQRPSLLVFENVESSPLTLLSDHLSDLYGFMSGIFSPLDLGWPVRRPRRYSFGWLKTEFRFLESWDDFAATMFKTDLPELTADDFLLAPKAERLDYMKRLAEIQGHFFAEDWAVFVFQAIANRTVETSVAVAVACSCL
ncbi:unnamed protein product [Symbiodinium microadriaticum]|nr:unnamed protein product [Symbiodinium microadriaticum]